MYYKYIISIVYFDYISKFNITAGFIENYSIQVMFET